MHRTIEGSCNKAEVSGLEAFSCAKAAKVSGNEGGVAGVFVGTHVVCRENGEALNLKKPQLCVNNGRYYEHVYSSSDNGFPYKQMHLYY